MVVATTRKPELEPAPALEPSKVQRSGNGHAKAKSKAVKIPADAHAHLAELAADQERPMGDLVADLIEADGRPGRVPVGGTSSYPRRGHVWEMEFDPVRGHDQGGRRPAMIISTDILNSGPSSLVYAIPITTRNRGVRYHVPVLPPEGGLTNPSFVLCDQVRSMTQERLLRYRGSVSEKTLDAVAYRLQALFELG